MILEVKAPDLPCSSALNIAMTAARRPPLLWGGGGERLFQVSRRASAGHRRRSRRIAMLTGSALTADAASAGLMPRLERAYVSVAEGISTAVEEEELEGRPVVLRGSTWKESHQEVRSRAENHRQA